MYSGMSDAHSLFLVSEMIGTAWSQQERCMLEYTHLGSLLWSHSNVHQSLVLNFDFIPFISEKVDSQRYVDPNKADYFKAVC